MTIWKYGDDINTDMLFPGKYTYTCARAEDIIPHLLEDLDPEFSKSAAKGDLILAGKNFGCGSSREQPALGLQALGIRAVVAKSFARIFYRAAINQGLLLIECPEAVDAFHDNAELAFDEVNATISIDGKPFAFPRLPRDILAIRDAGGLLPYTRELLKQN